MLGVEIGMTEARRMQAGQSPSQLDGSPTTAPSVALLHQKESHLRGGQLFGHHQKMLASTVFTKGNPAGAGQILALQTMKQSGLTLGKGRESQAITPGLPPLPEPHTTFNFEEGANTIGRAEMGSQHMAVAVAGDMHPTEGGDGIGFGHTPLAQAPAPGGVDHHTRTADTAPQRTVGDKPE